MYEVSEDEFYELCQEAYETIPSFLRDDIENVAIVILDEPRPDQLASVGSGAWRSGTLLLGLYSGIPLTSRGAYYGSGEAPDVISIFKHPHEIISENREDLAERIRVTIVHELGHHFGMDEEQLRQMGYGSS